MNGNSISSVDTRRNPAKDSGNNALRIEQLQCLNLRERQVSCTRCADTCPARALKLTADEVRLDAERCTACGACLPACPSGALRLSGFDPREFLQAVAGAAEIHVRCSRSDDPDGGNIVPCLQVLDARLLAAAAADGVRSVVLHGTAQCAGCDRGDARAAVQQMQADLKRWFTDAPVRLIREGRTEIVRGARRGEDRVHLGRRKFLGLAGARAAHTAAKLFADAAGKQDQGTSRWPVFPRDGDTGRPSDYQELLAERAGPLPWRDQQLPWRSRVISDACNACLTCAQRCPTGALAPEESESAVSIWFDLRRCTDCGLCERLCPEGAISCAAVVRPEELRAPPRRVMQRRRRRCAGCARRFVPGPGSAELCTACQNERDVESDWKAMLGESPEETILPH